MTDPVERLRSICLALPRVTERVSHGEPSFFVPVGVRSAKDKQFVSLDDHHHGADHIAFWCPAGPGLQEALIERDPAVYFRPPYVGHRGWVGVRIDADPDWDEVAEVVLDAYRLVAPKALIDEFDELNARDPGFA